MTRREVLRLAGRGALVGGLGLLLAACGGSLAPANTGAGASGSAKPAASGGLQLPTYVPFQGPKPDLPGTSAGVDAAFFTFPKQLVKSVAQTPGTGGDVNSLTITTATPPKPMDQNSAWQEVNKQLGVTFKMNIIGSGDYRARLTTQVSGGDLPDLIYNVQSNLPQAPDFMKASLADLTPYLSGDAIRDYPNLATFPTAAWRGTIFNGAIYAVPVPRAPFGFTMQYRQDILDQAGIPLPKSAADFKKVVVQLTQPSANRWGMAILPATAFALNNSGNTGNFFLQVFKAPNNWRNDNGKLVKDFETDEYKAAIAFARDIVSAGVVTPTSWSSGGTVGSDEMHSGKAAMYTNSWGAFIQGWDLTWAVNPNAKDYPMPLFAFDGSKPIHHFGAGNFGMTFIKKGTPDRVKMLLRVLDFLAAPFGSQEAVLLNYGIAGKHYNPDPDGNPVLTDLGKAEANTSWKYVTASAPALYDIHSSKDFATVAHAWEEATTPLGITDPTLGLYSATDTNQGFSLAMSVYDGVQDIVLSRRPVSDFDQLVKDWKSKGGDTIRAEYQSALQAAK